MPQVLTEEDVARSLIPTKDRRQLADSVVRGLLLRTGNTPSWYVRTSTGGVRKTSFGSPPKIGLELARQIAREAVEDFAKGKTIDATWVQRAHKRHGLEEPQEKKEAFREAPGPWTWEDAAEAWLHYLEQRGRSPVTLASYRKSLLQVLSDLRPRLMSDITTADAQAALDEVAETYPALAVQVLKAVRPFGQWASIGYRRDLSGVRELRFRRLVVDPPKDRQARGWQPVSRHAVARLVAMARLGVLSDSVSRCLEVLVWTGLPRSAVVSAKPSDIAAGVWTIRAEVLKRRQAIRIPLHPRLQELMSGGTDEWVFPQPRRPRHGLPSFLPVEGLGRATYELPDVPTATEAALAMRHYLQSEGGLPEDVVHLTDSGGDDEEKDEDGVPLWARRGSMIEDWHKVIEPLVPEQAANLDPAEIKARMLAARSYRS